MRCARDHGADASVHGGLLRPAPGKQRYAWRRRVIRLLIVLCGLAAYGLRMWWVSPQHRISQAAAATSQGDWRALLRLADKAEVDGLSLTPEKLGRLADACMEWTGGRYRLASERVIPYSPRQRLYNRARLFRICDEKGAPRRAMDGGEAGAFIVAYKTDRGWKIGLSSLARQMMRLGHSDAAASNAAYVRACMRAGIPPRQFSPEGGVWKDLPAAAPTPRHSGPVAKPPA